MGKIVKYRRYAVQYIAWILCGFMIRESLGLKRIPIWLNILLIIISGVIGGIYTAREMK